ncbi:MAG: hypothetical protein IK001_08415 [Lachnospiraceae bacterium]|nr:hypothetical protein [Lachnospiraceae bacterium]
MQSKTSSSDFFNKTLYKKNRKRFWPIWVGYSFLIFWMLCAMTYLSLHMSFFGVGRDQLYKSTISFLYGEAVHSCFWPALIFSLFTALAVFSYLGNERSCYYFHSLPMTRGQLFANGFISGFSMMFVPNVALYLFTNMFCLTDGLNAIKALSVWLLVITVEELFFFSFAALCMIVFGNNLATPVMYTIFVFFTEGMQLLINGMYSMLFFGSTSSIIEIPNKNPLGIISPLRFFRSFSFYASEDLAKKGIYDCYRATDYQFVMIMITASVVSVLFIALAVFLYNRRKSEHSGDVVAIESLRPVFRWGFGICFAILFTTLIEETLMSSIEFTTKLIITTFFLLMIFGVIAYIAAEMIIKKSFRVFKGLGVRFGVYVAFLALVSCVLLFAGDRVTKYVPERNEVKEFKLFINGYTYEFTDAEDIDILSDLHKNIVEQKEAILEHSMKKTYGYNVNMTFAYVLDNGRSVRRAYGVPNDHEVMKKMTSFLAANAVRLIFGDPATEKYSTCEVVLPQKDFSYDYRSFYDAQINELVKALVKDYESGYISLEEMAPDFLRLYIASSIEPGETYRIELTRKYDPDDEYSYGSYHVVYFNKYCINTMEYLRRYINFDNYF